MLFCYAVSFIIRRSCMRSFSNVEKQRDCTKLRPAGSSMMTGSVSVILFVHSLSSYIIQCRTLWALTGLSVWISCLSLCPQCFDTLGWVAGRASGPFKKNWVMRCWCGYLSGARCKRLAYGLADAEWYILLVPAYPGSPRQRAVEWLLLLLL